MGEYVAFLSRCSGFTTPLAAVFEDAVMRTLTLIESLDQSKSW